MMQPGPAVTPALLGAAVFAAQSLCTIIQTIASRLFSAATRMQTCLICKYFGCLAALLACCEWSAALRKPCTPAAEHLSAQVGLT